MPQGDISYPTTAASSAPARRYSPGHRRGSARSQEEDGALVLLTTSRPYGHPWRARRNVPAVRGEAAADKRETVGKGSGRPLGRPDAAVEQGTAISPIMAGGWSRAHGTGDQVAGDTLRSIGHDSCALDENLRATRPVSRSLISWSNRCDGRATMPDPDRAAS
jgi:hypothetical protein